MASNHSSGETSTMIKTWMTIKGTEKALKKLKRTEQKIARKVLSTALRNGAKEIRKEALVDFPINSGNAKKNLKVRTRKAKKGYVRYQVRSYALNKKGKPYYMWVEAGTKMIMARNHVKKANAKVEDRVINEIEKAIKIAV